MKTILTNILLLLSIVSFSAPVDSIRAKKIAIKFMKRVYPDKESYTIKKAQINFVNDTPTTYEIIFASGGYVIVPASDATVPVFVFSENGILDKTDMAPATQQIYMRYNKTVYYLIKNQTRIQY